MYLHNHITTMESNFQSRLSQQWHLLTLNFSINRRHEGVWENGCIDPRFLEFGTSWRWVVSFTPRSLYPRVRSPWYPLDRLGESQNRSGRHGEVEMLDPHRDSNSDPSVVQPVASPYTDCTFPAHVITTHAIQKMCSLCFDWITPTCMDSV
jgi:hypothetical protein